MQWNIRGLVLGSIVLGAVGFSACSDDEDTLPPSETGGIGNAGTTSKGGAANKGGAVNKGGAGNLGGAATGGTTGVGGGSPTTGGTTAVSGGAAGATTVASGGVGVGGTSVGVGGTSVGVGGTSVGVGGTTTAAGGNAGVGNVAGTAGAPLGTAGAAGASSVLTNPPVYPFSSASEISTDDSKWHIRPTDTFYTLVDATAGTTFTHSTDEGGIAHWTVPFTTAGQQSWVFTYMVATDLTGKTVKARVRWTSGGKATASSTASFNFVLSIMDNQDYDSMDSSATTVTAAGVWTDLSFPVPAASGTWQPDRVSAITLRLSTVAGGDYGTGVFDIDYVTYE